jgi:uncharacterized protein YjiS (DUF1127 family)
MTLQSTFGSGRAATRPSQQGGTRPANADIWLSWVLDLLGQRRERMRSRRQQRILCALDDHILKDIGLTRSELSCMRQSDRRGAGLEWSPNRGSR